MKTPNYVLTESRSYNSHTLEAGTFVRPIKWEYLPKHITQDDKYKYVNLVDNVFVYCFYGIILIPKYLLREV